MKNKLNKCQKIPKGNQKWIIQKNKLANQSTQDEAKNNMCQTPFYAKKHKKLK